MTFVPGKYLGAVARSAVVLLLTLAVTAQSAAQVDRVMVDRSDDGFRLMVDGEPLMINGMNWDYIPIGQNYSWSLWNQPDDVIKAALEREMLLLKNMNVNAIRHYVGIPPRWIRYIYETYGIYTMLNHPLGRYGVTVGGVWMQNTDYSNPQIRQMLKDEMRALVEEYRNTPGVLLWLLGNENNYGLSWSSAETEALPEGERQSAKARYLYSLYHETIDEIKDLDQNHPVAICNGDLQYIDIIAEEVTNMDIYGTNMYRGISFRDAFEVVSEKLDVPFMFTEFGADAYNAKTLREDQIDQARFLAGQWREIYEQAAGMGKVGNSIGGFTFQFSDGWWKYRQEINLSIHDTNASWPNAAYPYDYVEGANNMNEEWWGICAKGAPSSSGLYELYPRAAYYVLADIHEFDPYADGADLQSLEDFFAKINPMKATLQARGDAAALGSGETSKVRFSGLRIEMETYNTGGDNIETPESASSASDSYPSFLGFDHMQSYYASFEGRPSGNVYGTVTLSILGHVPVNSIDEIFYENRGRPMTVLENTTTPTEINDNERVKVYSARVLWEENLYNLEGFYRTGHYHWGYEGDFFGLYREANYGPNLDIYNGEAPIGFEATGKKMLHDISLAFGPQLWWGANPAVMARIKRSLGSIAVTGVYQKDLQQQSDAVSSIAIPIPETEKIALAAETQRGALGVQLGVLRAGSNKVGQLYQIAEGSSGNYTMLQDDIKGKDTWGAKFKLTWSSGRWNVYVQGAHMGLVADAGPTVVQTFTGWRLTDSGLGNQQNLIGGFTYLMGDLQIAPNFLWQKPLEGPVPSDVPVPGRPRNVLDDPFAVRANREMIAGELLITYDPTPATWMYTWDSDIREDAAFAMSAGIILRSMKTTMDAGLGFLEDGRTIFAFPGATPPRDHWEAYARIVSKHGANWGMVANLYGGTGEPNGDDPRMIHRYGADLRLIKRSTKLMLAFKKDDWGPYDYHRDFNLTYPEQWIADLSTSVGMPEWFDMPATRFGIRYSWRSLNEYSPRYCPTQIVNDLGALECDPTATQFGWGSEWEFRTYLHFNVGN